MGEADEVISKLNFLAKLPLDEMVEAINAI